MNILSHFKNIVNLNWKKVKILGLYEEKKKIIVQIRGKYNNTTCPHCVCNTNKRQDRKLHKQVKLLPHMPYGGDKMILLELHKRYFRCSNCNTRFSEKFDFESSSGIYSNHFEKYVQWNWGFVSGNKIAKLYQTSVSVIHSILQFIHTYFLGFTHFFGTIPFSTKSMYIKKLCARFCIKELQI